MYKITKLLLTNIKKGFSCCFTISLNLYNYLFLYTQLKRILNKTMLSYKNTTFSVSMMTTKYVKYVRKICIFEIIYNNNIIK